MFFSLETAFKTWWEQTDWLRKHACTILRFTLHFRADPWTMIFGGRAGYPKWKHRFSDPSFTIPEDIHIRDTRLAMADGAGTVPVQRR